jgi:hypothetical protein
MTPRKFLQTTPTKGLPLTAITLTACVTSLISIVACLDVGTVTEVLPNSTQQYVSGKSPQNLNNTLHIFESHDKSSTENLGGKDSEKNPEVEYFGVPDVSHNMSTVSQERTDRTWDIIGDTIKQGFEPSEGMNGLEWLQNVYNPHLWGSSPPVELGTKCGEDMRTYLAGLNNGSVWAAKSKYMHCVCHTTHY